MKEVSMQELVDHAMNGLRTAERNRDMVDQEKPDRYFLASDTIKLLIDRVESTSLNVDDLKDLKMGLLELQDRIQSERNRVESRDSHLKENPGLYMATEDGRIINVDTAVKHYIDTMRPVGTSLAELVYMTYWECFPQVNDVIPVWSELTENIQAAWYKVVQVVKQCH